MFNDEQIERYSRHIILQDVGVDGQEKICKSKILIIGAGGLGSPAAFYLAAAGVSTIGIADYDNVDVSNLGRQIIHFTEDVGSQKVESAKKKINKLNPEVKVITYQVKISSSDILDVIKDYDFVIDGTDNFSSKFLINDACVLGNKPFSHGGILRFQGQTMTYVPGSTCYRCVFNFPPPKNAVPTCSQAGILGSVAGILGTIQATEALKFVIGKGDLLVNRLLTFDALKMEFRTVKIPKNSRCPICGENPTIKTLVEYELPACDPKKG